MFKKRRKQKKQKKLEKIKIAHIKIFRFKTNQKSKH